jgi:anaerobic magnesium-protoporphyrin IX monomethyl ester cyclase
VDIVLVNPPTPDGGLWIRTQHRVGRRTRENMVWPQVSLAQMAACCIRAQGRRYRRQRRAHGLGRICRSWTEYRPKYYLTQVTAPTLENDMYGCFLAKARGAKTIAFGTHVTPIPRETLRPYPALDYVLMGEPDLTIRDLLDHLEGKIDQRPPEMRNCLPP